MAVSATSRAPTYACNLAIFWAFSAKRCTLRPNCSILSSHSTDCRLPTVWHVMRVIHRSGQLLYQIYVVFLGAGHGPSNLFHPWTRINYALLEYFDVILHWGTQQVSIDLSVQIKHAAWSRLYCQQALFIITVANGVNVRKFPTSSKGYSSCGHGHIRGAAPTHASAPTDFHRLFHKSEYLPVGDFRPFEAVLASSLLSIYFYTSPHAQTNQHQMCFST